MLSNKVTELFENTIFKNIYEFVNSKLGFNYVFAGLFLYLFYSFDFGSLIKFSLFLLSLKFLLNMDNFNLNDKLKHMTNLLKFWMFYTVLTFGFGLFEWILHLPLFYKLVQVYILYYLYKQSSDWFLNNNLMVKNENEVNTQLSGSISLVDSTLNKIVKVYSINKLSLDFSLNTILYLLNKFNTSFESFETNMKNLVKKTPENQSVDIPVNTVENKVSNFNEETDKKDDIKEEKTDVKEIKEEKNKLSDHGMDLLLDSVLQETLAAENSNNIDKIDDENFSIFTKKNS